MRSFLPTLDDVRMLLAAAPPADDRYAADGLGWFREGLRVGQAPNGSAALGWTPTMANHHAWMNGFHYGHNFAAALTVTDDAATPRGQG